MYIDKFDKYYKKSSRERIEILKEYISTSSYNSLINKEVLSDEIASSLIENHIGILSMPYGIATNFLINGDEYLIPMCTEEPSVIAAASNAASIIKKNGGIKASIEKRLAIGQISYYNAKNSIENVILKKEELLRVANLSHEGINLIGGGARDIKIEKKDKFVILYLYVDAKDAMGANIVNTMLESIADIVGQILDADKLMSIISNYATESIVKASCELELEKELMDKIALACDFANVDIYRATTNNKGIFNGIDALALATANDFRAIEAGAHAYATRNGKYQSLTKWYRLDNKLVGEIELPMAIATKGACIEINPMSKVSLDILRNPNAKQLSMIAASLGLAQNFAALRALVTVGIQKGHMKLHARSVAIFAGANENEIDYVVNKMVKDNKIELVVAKKILGEIRNESNS